MGRVKEFRLTGNILEIKTINATPKTSLLYEGEISQSFSTKIGLKEDNVLLFNFSINDLP